MKKTLITLIGFCLLMLGVVAVSPLAKIHRFSADVLQEQVRSIEMELYPLMTEPQNHRGKISDLKQELFWFDLEIKRKQWELDFLLWFVLLGSCAWLAYVFLKQRNPAHVSTSIHEITPTEKYVDPFDFERAKAGGFASKEEAYAWFDHDKLRTCEYCGGPNRPEKNTSPNSVQFCTFYKQVPEGAKDLRIVLGSVWNVLPADTLICQHCATKTQRG